MESKAKGRLIIIGGHEDKEGDEVILQEVCRDAVRKKGPLVVVTVASQEPKELARNYTRVFKDLGVPEVRVLDIREREDGKKEKNVQLMDDAAVIFFTGGDQLRITSQMGDTLVYQRMRQFLKEGGTIAGTSAGAAAMPETMIIGGPNDQSNRVYTTAMAPGLGLISGVVIDSHFAERGRIGRLLGAVTQNPSHLGIGIDEDTAILTEGPDRFRVIGSGAVYIIDGTNITHSSLSEADPEAVVNITNATLHVLASGDLFSLKARSPILPEKAK